MKISNESTYQKIVLALRNTGDFIAKSDLSDF